VSDYHFYEFAVVDQPLTPTQQEQLRRVSSRAHISAFGFTDTYHRGNLKADPLDLIARYFDALVHSTNANECWLALRFPKHVFHPMLLDAYATAGAYPQRFGVFSRERFQAVPSPQTWQTECTNKRCKHLHP